MRAIDTKAEEVSNDSPELDKENGELISRQAAIDAVCMEWCNVKHQDCKHPFDVKKGDYYWCDGCETVLRTLPELPSAQPKHDISKANFLCPICGAEMEVAVSEWEGENERFD